MKEQLANIRAQALAALDGAQDSAALDALRVKYRRLIRIVTLAQILYSKWHALRHFFIPLRHH